MTTFRSTLRRHFLPFRILRAEKPPTGLVHQYAERPEVGRLRHALLERLCVSCVGVHEHRLATEILELSVTYVPYDPSFKTPDERGALTDAL
jgi:hypothetical protein